MTNLLIFLKIIIVFKEAAIFECAMAVLSTCKKPAILIFLFICTVGLIFTVLVCECVLFRSIFQGFPRLAIPLCTPFGAWHLHGSHGLCCLPPADRRPYWLSVLLFHPTFSEYVFCSFSTTLLAASPAVSMIYVWFVGKIHQDCDISIFLGFWFSTLSMGIVLWPIPIGNFLFNVLFRFIELFQTLAIVHPLCTSKIFPVISNCRTSFCALPCSRYVSVMLMSLLARILNVTPFSCLSVSSLVLLFRLILLHSVIHPSTNLNISFSRLPSLYQVLFRRCEVKAVSGLCNTILQTFCIQGLRTFPLCNPAALDISFFLIALSSLSTLLSTLAPSYVIALHTYLVATAPFNLTLSRLVQCCLVCISSLTSGSTLCWHTPYHPVL